MEMIDGINNNLIDIDEMIVKQNFLNTLVNINNIKNDETLIEYKNSIDIKKITKEKIVEILFSIDAICKCKIKRDFFANDKLGLEYTNNYFLGNLIFNFGIKKLNDKEQEVIPISNLNDTQYNDFEEKDRIFTNQLDYHSEYTVFRKYGLKNIFNTINIIFDKFLFFLKSRPNSDNNEEKEILDKYIYDLFLFIEENNLFKDKDNDEVVWLRNCYFIDYKIETNEENIRQVLKKYELKLNKFKKERKLYIIDEYIDSFNKKVNIVNDILKNEVRSCIGYEHLVKFIIVSTRKINAFIENIDFNKLNKFSKESKIYSQEKDIYSFLLTNFGKKHYDIRNFRLYEKFNIEIFEKVGISYINIQKAIEVCNKLVNYDKFENRVLSIYKFEKGFRFFYLLYGYKLFMNEVFKDNKILLNQSLKLFNIILTLPNCLMNIYTLKKLMKIIIAISKGEEISNDDDIKNAKININDIIENLEFFKYVIIPYYNSLFDIALKFVFGSYKDEIINKYLYNISEELFLLGLSEEYSIFKASSSEEFLSDLFTEESAKSHDVKLFAKLASSINETLFLENKKSEKERFLDLLNGIKNKWILSLKREDLSNYMITLD